MKTSPAIAALEFDDIPAGVVAMDAMLKKAPIAFFKSGTITRGRYLALIGGTTASVEEAAAEGRRSGAGHLLDEVVLADVHPRLYDAVLGSRKPHGTASLAVMETATVSAAIRGAEAALKGTPVELVEIRLADIGLAGKGLVVFEGELHHIEAAVALAVDEAERRSTRVSSRIIPAPHDGIMAQVGNGSYFDSALLVELGGETL